MKKFLTTLLLVLVTSQLSVAQTKQLEGKRGTWFNRTTGLQKTFGLKDFETSKDEFNFRIWNFGQVVEITKDSSIVKGTITNYIYHSSRRRREKHGILSGKILLTKAEANNALEIIENSKILTVPSDENIKNWPHGADGII